MGLVYDETTVLPRKDTAFNDYLTTADYTSNSGGSVVAPVNRFWSDGYSISTTITIAAKRVLTFCSLSVYDDNTTGANTVVICTAQINGMTIAYFYKSCAPTHSYAQQFFYHYPNWLLLPNDSITILNQYVGAGLGSSEIVIGGYLI